MIDHEKLRETAVKKLLDGYNCAQATLLSCQELFDMRNDEVMKAATGFGGGIGNQCDICGALAGGVIALGQKFGRADLSEQEAEKKEKTYLLCSEYLKKFQESNGSRYCRDILGVDITDPETRKRYWTDENRKRCAEGPVLKGLKILCELFQSNG